MWLNHHISFEEVYTSLVFVCQQCMSIHIPVLLKFYSLFLAVLGLRCCAGFSLVVSRGLLFATVCGFPLRWLVLLGSTGFRVCGLGGCSSQALERRLLAAVLGLSSSSPCGILPDQGSNHVFCVGRWFFTTEPPRKP